MPEPLSRDGLMIPFLSLSVFWWSILPFIARATPGDLLLLLLLCFFFSFCVSYRSHVTSPFEAFRHVLSAPWETVCVTSENVPIQHFDRLRVGGGHTRQEGVTYSESYITKYATYAKKNSRFFRLEWSGKGRPI